METGETIVREFEDLFGLITMTERKWLADRITAAVSLLPAGQVAPEGWQLIPKAPPDDLCLLLSALGWGFSVPERIANGRKRYEWLLANLPAPPSINKSLTGGRPDDREPVDAVKAGYSYLRANSVCYGGGPTVYSEHGQMISNLLDYIQRLRGVIREANTRLRHPDSGSTSGCARPSTELDLRPSEVIVREQRDAWPDRQKP